jgi:hypothetical protein
LLSKTDALPLHYEKNKAGQKPGLKKNLVFSHLSELQPHPSLARLTESRYPALRYGWQS